MEILIAIISKKIVPGALMTLLTGLTVGSSVMGVGKIAGNFASDKVQGAENNAAKSTDNNGSQPTEKGQVGAAVVQAGTSNSGSDSTTTATGQINAASTGTNTTSNQCILTLFGKQYDVTSVKSSHPGGDTFVCGTDMTAQYQRVHGTNMARMQPFLITASTDTTGSPSNTGSGSTSSGQSSGSNAGTGSSGTATSKCILTLFGKQYDVTSVKSSHPGGDTFVCGTDMTAQYQRVHGTNMARMQPFLIANAGTGTSSGGSGGSTGVSTGGSTGSQGPKVSPKEKKAPTHKKHKHEDRKDHKDHHDDDEREIRMYGGGRDDD